MVLSLDNKHAMKPVTLVQVLSPLLLEEELHIIFGRVTNLFSKSLADAYARLEPLVSDLPAVLPILYVRACTAPEVSYMHEVQGCLHVDGASVYWGQILHSISNVHV